MEKTKEVAGKKVDKSRIISLEKGKIPPQAVELEEAVLGAMMIDKKGIDDVIDILSPDAFYDSKHHEIYAAIFECTYQSCWSLNTQLAASDAFISLRRF